jgi:hypothetical protein
LKIGVIYSRKANELSNNELMAMYIYKYIYVLLMHIYTYYTYTYIKEIKIIMMYSLPSLCFGSIVLLMNRTADERRKEAEPY